METEKSLGEEAEKDFAADIFLGCWFPFSNEKACLGVTAKTDFFYRLKLSYPVIQELFIYSLPMPKRQVIFNDKH